MSYGSPSGWYPNLLSYICRLFYLGDRYFGSQFQPGLTTVQEELINALSKWSKETHTTKTVQLAGRTDKGVHSFGQVVQIHMNRTIRIDEINDYLPDDIILWAHAPIRNDFRPRFDALMRHYRYFFYDIQENPDIRSMRLALQDIIGSHDFSSLAKPDGDRPTTTTIINASLSKIDNTLHMDMFGTNFLWKLVRKTATLLIKIGQGELNHKIIKHILETKEVLPSGVMPAAPEALVLMETVVPIQFNTSKHALRRIQNHLNNRIKYLGRFHHTLSSFSDYFSFQGNLS
ncbi:MAG: tRNA pseudouridine(38-40) synthase TruA [Candidatus Hodarchaeota archaeon]